MTAPRAPVRERRAHHGGSTDTRTALYWQAPIFNFSGYGDESRAMILALQHRGHPVTARMWGQEVPGFIDQLADAAPDRLLALHRATTTPLSPPFISILHAPGYAATRVAGASANVIRTMFETDSLPPEWVPRLNQMDEIWVAASSNVESFTGAGVTAPIKVVPGGVDASMFRPGLRPLRLPGVRCTVFLSIFEWAYRKGWDVLLSAWAQAFGPDDDVTLVLRSAPIVGTPGHELSVETRIDAHLESLGKLRSEVAPIVVLDRPLSLADLPRLYAAADVYVGASRGEGWGRPLMEAMACRLPTVGTRWGGNLDFMNDENSVLLDIEGLVEIDQRADIAFYVGQRWAEPSVGHLSEIMGRLAADPALRKRLGTKARMDVERQWQWKQVAAVAAERVDALGAAAGFALGRTVTGENSVAPASTTVSQVRWEGDFYAHHSLAVANRAMVAGLLRSGGMSVQPSTREAAPFAPDTTIEVDRIVRSNPPGLDPEQAEVVVRHRWPPDLTAAGTTPLVLMQPWEFGGIPAAWIPQIQRHVTEVWCGTTWVKDCYVRSGVPESMVAVVPYGVDVERFNPSGGALPLATNKGTKLLFVGGTIPRKGIDVLLRAYLETFGPADDVCLVVKAFGSGHVYRGSTIDEQLREVANDPDSAALELIDDELTDDQVAMLYRSCDLLVHPYRGEGFGLPIAEAMASGLPVMVTGYGACLDFCSEDNALFVPAALTPVQLPEIGPSSIGYWWAEPDAAALGQLLAEVVADPSILVGRGQRGRERIVSRFTWDAAAAIAAERLRALAVRQVPPAQA